LYIQNIQSKQPKKCNINSYRQVVTINTNTITRKNYKIQRQKIHQDTKTQNVSKQKRTKRQKINLDRKEQKIEQKKNKK